jgi:hypothetical protein
MYLSAKLSIVSVSPKRAVTLELASQFSTSEVKVVEAKDCDISIIIVSTVITPATSLLVFFAFLF